MGNQSAQYKSAVRVVQTLRDGGFEAFFAGGWVRDFVMGGGSGGDIDIATSAVPEDIRRLFGRTVGVGEQFGVMIVLMDGTPFEVATFRADVGIGDGRHPESVVYTNAENDALRRDFTINGMFYDPLTEEIIDYVGGRLGISGKIIKAIGDPSLRFAEDYLRMLRAVRFAARFGFDIDGDTFAAIRASAHRIKAISVERIFAEMNKMLTGPNPHRSLELLHGSGLLAHFLPEAEKLHGVEQPVQFHPEGDVFAHTVKTLSLLPPNPSPALAWAALLHDIGKPLTQTVTDRIRFNNHNHAGAKTSKTILKRLHAPNALIEAVESMVENHMNFINVTRMRLSTLKKFLSRDTIHDELDLHKADCLSSHGELDNYHFIKEKLADFKAEEIKPDPLVTGKDLINLGLKPGPAFGKILGEIYDLQLEDKITTREEALNAARNAAAAGVDAANKGGAAGGLILALILILVSTAAHAQNRNFYGPPGSTVYSISDRHFRKVLFPEAYKALPSTKINYPGLWVPERGSASFAFLPNHLPPNTAGWNGLYGWADIDLHPGSAGFWIGDLDYGDGYRVGEHSDMIFSWQTHELSLRGALWVTPYNNDRLRGFSASIDIDNAYAFNGNVYEGLTDIRHVCFNLNTLLRVGGNYNLRAALSVSNRHSEDPASLRLDNRRLFTDAISLTLVDSRLRTLELRAQNTFAMNYADEKSDTVSAGLRFTQGWVRRHMKHALFAGVKAETGVYMHSNISDDAGSFQYMYYLQNLTAEGRVFRASLDAPIILDADLFRGVRAMLSISPQAVYAHTSPRYPPQESHLYLNPQHRFYLYMPPAELSFRGTAGDKFDIAVKPSLTSDVLISALEIRYRF
jgi:poly(A) polymerase